MPESMYALFIYNPALNSTTYADKNASLEALMKLAETKFQDTLMFSVYKFREHTVVGTAHIPMTKWELEIKFDGKKVSSLWSNTNQPMLCAYQLDEYVWFFKSL